MQTNVSVAADPAAEATMKKRKNKWFLWKY